MNIPNKFYRLLIEENLDLIIGPVFSDTLKEIYNAVDNIKIPVLSFSNNRKLRNKNVWLLGKMHEDEIEHIIEFGVKTGKVVMTVMTNRGLKSVLKERIKFGVDVDAVVVSDGVGYSAESTLRLADIYSFTDNEGLFLGSSIEGSYLQPRNDLNRFLYKQEFDSEEILKSNEPRIEINNIIKIIQNITNEKSEK